MIIIPKNFFKNWAIQNDLKVLIKLYDNYRHNLDKYSSCKEISQSMELDYYIIYNNLKILYKRGHTERIGNNRISYTISPSGIEFVESFIKELESIKKKSIND